MAKKLKERKIAVAYLRTSSATNVGADKDSERRQREAIAGYAARNNVEIVEWYYDAAVSGADPIDTRPGFAAALERIASNGIRTIIVETANRFARDLIVQETGYRLLRENRTDNKPDPIELIAADSPDSFLEDTPTASLIRQVLGAVAQFEKAALVAKLKGARDRKRRGNDGNLVKVEGRLSPPDQLRSRLVRGPASKEAADKWRETVLACLPPKLAERLPRVLTGPVDRQLADEIAAAYAAHLAEAVATAKRLYRASPKTGERRSLRQVSAELAALGYLNERGQRFNPYSVRAMVRSSVATKTVAPTKPAKRRDADLG